MNISQYMYGGEIICLFLAAMSMFFMLNAKPRKSYNFYINLIGAAGSLAGVMLEIVISGIIIQPEYYNKRIFETLLLIFIVDYVIVICSIVTYINRLSSKAWFNSQILSKVYAGLFVIYILAAIILIDMGEMYGFQDGIIRLKFFAPFYVVIGLLGVFSSVINVIINKKYFSKPVSGYIALFGLMDAFVLILQVINRETIFTAITYVFPTFVFYLLFHHNLYDAESGCQNNYSFETRIQDSVRWKRKFTVAFVTVPALERLDNFNQLITIDSRTVFAEACRKTEYISSGIDLFRIGTGTFAIYIDNKKGDSKNKIDKIIDIIDTLTNNENVQTYYKLVVFNDNQKIKSIQLLRSMNEYLYGKLSSSPVTEKYIATDNDYEAFEEHYKIEQMLVDIRNKDNLDDERVVCYVQPIYSIEANSFRTGEALMRLTMDGKTIFPDKFIPLAEKNDCIHSLTKIIINKVCKNIVELRDDYDFDAITVNCSSIELSDVNFAKEILEIIEANGVETSYIRLELTESAIFENFNMVMDNIKVLTEAGIKFYLDDFGTGYSNLERILSCPFSTIKFDKSLLYKSLEDKTVAELVSDMTKVFKKKGINMLIEGVENDECARFAIENSFDYIQGYKYARPNPVDKLKEYFKRR